MNDAIKYLEQKGFLIKQREGACKVRWGKSLIRDYENNDVMSQNSLIMFYRGYVLGFLDGGKKEKKNYE